MNEQIFGWISILLCLVGFGFQINKLLFKKTIKSISLLTFSIAIVGSSLWSIHSLFASAFHGGFENAIITFGSGVILFCSARDKINLTIRLLVCSAIWVISLVLGSMLLVNYLSPETIVFPHNQLVEFLTGCSAGALMSLSFLPQVFKVVKTRNAVDISFGMCAFYGAAQIVLITYWSSRSSLEIGEWLPGVIFCSCVLSLQVCLLFLKSAIEKNVWILARNKKDL